MLSAYFPRNLMYKRTIHASVEGGKLKILSFFQVGTGWLMLLQKNLSIFRWDLTFPSVLKITHELQGLRDKVARTWDTVTRTPGKKSAGLSSGPKGRAKYLLRFE